MHDVSEAISIPWDKRYLASLIKRRIKSLYYTFEGLMNGILKGFCGSNVSHRNTLYIVHLRWSRECIPGNPGCITLRVYEFHVQDHTRSPCVCTRMWVSYVNVHVWHGALGLPPPPLNAKDDRLGRVGRSWSGWHPPRRCGDSETCVRARTCNYTRCSGRKQSRWADSRIRHKKCDTITQD